MVDPKLFSSGFWRHLLFGVALVALTGCSEDGALSFLQKNLGPERTVSVSGRSVALIEQDVEAPEVFQVTDRGLWDGRPSLGGIWVAHPDVDEPERVIIRNTENSEFVIGALFRRERDNPGPVLMVSSDAAAELGMLAGAPAKLNVTALRREASPDPEAEAEAAAALASDTEATAANTEATLAALPLAEGSNAASDTVASAAAVSAAEAESVVSADKTSVGNASLAASSEPSVQVLDRGKRYLQIGVFSAQAHAERTARVMTAAGMDPTIRTHSANGATVWRVVIGPADSLFSRMSMLEVVRAEGFTQAVPVMD